MTSQPSDSAAPAARKPRRLGLYIPWGIAAILAIAWSIGWLVLAHETGRRIDQSIAGLRAAGWQASWSSRQIGGYPFRLDADFTDLKLADPSGWGVAVPTLKSEAYVFAPTQWIIAAPAGLTFTRPGGGPVTVAARLLRASINSWDTSPPNIVLQGDDMTLTPGPGGGPFWLQSAKQLQIATRAAPDDQGEVWFSLTSAAVSPESWIGQIARGGPVNMTFDGVVFRAGTLRGGDWRDAARHWTHSGGGLDVRQFTMTAGEASLDSRRGSLAVADDGTLVGELDANLGQPGRLFAGLRAQPGETQTLKITFHNGYAWLGPVRIAPAPDLF
ncbi:MAG TPA: DUF2125 domain-containing protein [Caulobacteraceae bacterium]|nr:DUF2125 domain-containing protein [Caulobacteraceae bacterium]